MFENMFRRAEKSPQRKDDKEAQKRIDTVIDTKALSEEMESTLFQNKQLIEALARLVIELEDNITEYDTVLSDDASGRFVSLLLKNIIDKKREEVEKDKAQIYFVASGRDSNRKRDSAIKEFIADKKDSFGKTLLVTEYVQSGRSIKFLMELLEQQNIDFDTATVSIDGDPKDYSNDYTPRLSDYIPKIKYGAVRGIGKVFYSRSIFSGVEKPLRHELAHPKRTEEFDPEKVGAARRDIDTLSEELSKLI